MTPKPWWQSRVVWMNAIVAALGALLAIPNVLPTWAFALATVMVAIVNVFLRFDTDTPIN